MIYADVNIITKQPAIAGGSPSTVVRTLFYCHNIEKEKLWGHAYDVYMKSIDSPGVADIMRFFSRGNWSRSGQNCFFLENE